MYKSGKLNIIDKAKWCYLFALAGSWAVIAIIYSIWILPLLVQTGKTRSFRVEQSSARESRMETFHLCLAACRCNSSTGEYAKLGVYRDSSRTAIWIWYVFILHSECAKRASNELWNEVGKKNNKYKSPLNLLWQ